MTVAEGSHASYNTSFFPGWPLSAELKDMSQKDQRGERAREGAKERKSLEGSGKGGEEDRTLSRHIPRIRMDHKLTAA